MVRFLEGVKYIGKICYRVLEDIGNSLGNTGEGFGYFEKDTFFSEGCQCLLIVVPEDIQYPVKQLLYHGKRQFQEDCPIKRKQQPY